MFDTQFSTDSGVLPIETPNTVTLYTLVSELGASTGANSPPPPSKFTASVISEAGQADDTRLPPGQRYTLTTLFVEVGQVGDPTLPTNPR
jgi:hypothetical protein